MQLWRLRCEGGRAESGVERVATSARQQRAEGTGGGAGRSGAALQSRASSERCWLTAYGRMMQPRWGGLRGMQDGEGLERGSSWVQGGGGASCETTALVVPAFTGSCGDGGHTRQCGSARRGGDSAWGTRAVQEASGAAFQRGRAFPCSTAALTAGACRKPPRPHQSRSCS